MNCAVLLKMSLYVFVLLFLFVFYMWKMRKFYYASYKMKGPIGLPLIGNYLNFVGSTEDLYNTIRDLIKTYETPVRVWFGTNFTVFLTHPEDFKIILNSPHALVKPTTIYDFIFDIIGNSIFSLKNISRWRLHRKICESTFTASTLKSFIPIFEKKVHILCEKLEEKAGNGIIDDIDVILLVSNLSTILETVMGIKQDLHLDVWKYAKAVIEGMCAITKRMFCVWHHPNFIYMFTEQGKHYKKQLEIVQDFHKKIFAINKDQYEKSNNQNKQKVLLDYLVEISQTQEDCYTEKDVIHEIGLFLIAGTHSTAMTSSFALMLLGMHPEIQDKVYDELQEIFGDSKEAITKEDLDKMVFLQRVIKETIRLFPFSPVVGRKLSNDIQLSTCSLPKGTDCILTLIHAHRDPKVWPNPLKFDPNRFLPEEVAKRHPYAWVGFSGGARNCIGRKYAMIGLKIILSSILRKYRVYCDYKSVEDIKAKFDFTVVPVDGYRVALEKRTPK